MKRYRIGEIIKPEIIGTSTTLFIFEKIILDKKIPIKKVKKGDSFKFLYDFGDKIKFKIKIIKIEKLDLNVFKNGKHR